MKLQRPALKLGSKLSSCLEGKPDLTFPVLHKILRSNFGEPSVTELYRQLTSAVQEPREIPQQFLVRVMNLRQKIILHRRRVNQKLIRELSVWLGRGWKENIFFLKNFHAPVIFCVNFHAPVKSEENFHTP